MMPHPILSIRNPRLAHPIKRDVPPSGDRSPGRGRLCSLALIIATLLVSTLVSEKSIAAECGSAGQRACCLFEPPTNGGCEADTIDVPQANSGLCTGFNPFGIQSSSVCRTITPCGGNGQRACCLLEASFGACRAGHVEEPRANSGYCSTSSIGIQSSGICRQITPCGGDGQRACCLGEAGFGACRSGLYERPTPFSGQGQCGNQAPGIQSSGVCVAITACGGVGQRACCLGEASFGPCTEGLVEIPRPNSGQCGNFIPGIQSSSVCEVLTPCGGVGERACCLGEAGFGACTSGLVQVPQPNSGQCGNLLPGIQSSGVCELTSPCGGLGQRACCLGEAGFGACRAGLNEHPRSNSGQCGNQAPGIQSSGVCEPASELGEGCGPLYQCAADLFCDPFAGFTCVAAAGIDQACGPLVPCDDGLTCSLALRCSAQPAQIGQTCDFTAPCDDGLFCQPGLPQRCRELKKPGEGCSVVNPCIAGASCDPCLVEGCNAPLQCNLNANDGAISEAACRQIYSPDLQAAARDTGLTMTYAVGTELAGIVGESQSFGVSYGQNGRYGCFTTLCGGLNADVSVEAFASIGFYTDFDSVGGSSFANFQEVEIIGIFNFGTSQVFPRINALPIGDLIGTEDSFGLGLSPDLLPFSAGSYLCETVLDTVMIEPDMEDLPQVSLRPASVVANAGLRFDLTSWWCSDAALCAWSEDDALGSLSSGSGEVISPSPGAAESLGILGAACVSVLPGQNYELMAQAKTLGAQAGEVSAVWYAGLDCDDTVVQIDSVGDSPPDEVWRALSVVRVAPTNAQSMAIEISAERDEQTGRSSTSRLDVVMVTQTLSAATPSDAGAGGGGGGGGSCGLIGLEPFLILALVRFGRITRLRASAGGVS